MRRRSADKDMNMTTGSYRQAAQSLYNQAAAELDAGDVRQASEKGWGAAAQAVKATAERRGWEHRSPAALFQAVDWLSQEYRDPSIQRRFHVASSLHQNFYEDWMTEGNVRAALFDVADLVTMLANL